LVGIVANALISQEFDAVRLSIIASVMSVEGERDLFAFHVLFVVSSFVGVEEEFVGHKGAGKISLDVPPR
jgi:hypothetical protein